MSYMQFELLNKEELSKRVISRPFFVDWEYNGTNNYINDNGEINYDGLDDLNKMLLYIYAWNLSEICPSKKRVAKDFGWSPYKVYQQFKKLKEFGLKCVSTFSENTGLLTGKGYRYDGR